MWEMSQPRSLHVQKRLQAELRAHPDAPFDQLPYLDAVVTEGLRCFPAIPMSLPRYVPAGGRTIDGYFVSAPPFATPFGHRSPLLRAAVTLAGPGVLGNSTCESPMRWPSLTLPWPGGSCPSAPS